MAHDTFDLERFVRAQDADGIYEQALGELRRGRKRGHWMWFVFPQAAGLGRSAMAQRFAVSSLEEARAYLAHPVLGARLHACTDALASLGTASAVEVFGTVDAIKLRSSMTLFHRAAPEERRFTAVLERYFAGVPDGATDERLGLRPGGA